MARFPERNLKQTAVYWASPTPNGTGGFTWDDPVEIKCRWQSSSKLIMSSTVGTEKPGEEIVSFAEVHVSQDLEEQGMLYLGTLDDLDSAEEDDPTTVSGAYSIKRFDKIPTIKGTRFYRKAYL